MVRLRSRSVEDTHGVASVLEPFLEGGDVLVLSGDLAAGKTTFVQGLARAMGIAERVTSPTYTLLHTYEGRRTLHHLDLYRLDRPREAVDLDLPLLVSGDAVVAIEWGESVLSELPESYLVLRLRLDPEEPSPGARVVELELVGPAWEAKASAVREALEARCEVAS